MYKFLVFIIILIIFFKYISLKKIFPSVSSFIFGRISCQLDIKSFTTFDEYLTSLNSKKRKDLKKIIESMNSIVIKPGKFETKKYLKSLWNFIKLKYQCKYKRILNMFLSVIVFATNQLSFWEYYDNSGKFLGWSSYFIINNTYYDFICSPNEIKISYIGVNSLKFCIKNKLEIIDFGPTNCKLKMTKFNADIVEF